MRPCGANYENQCSSKWVAHGGGLRGTCKEGLGVEVPWMPWHTEQQHTALNVAVQPTAIHHRTCRQVADGPHIPACTALLPPGIKAGFPQSILVSRLSVLLHINKQQGRRSQCSVASGGHAQGCKPFKYHFTDIVPAIKLKQAERLFCSFYLYAGLEICGRISQRNMGFDWLIFSLWLQGSVKTVNLLGSPAGLRWL